jgi:transcription initiation factor TFIIH subunit 2
MEEIDDTIFRQDLDATEENDAGDHSWVQWYQRSWLEIQERPDGLVHVPSASTETLPGVRRQRQSSVSSGAVKKGLIRFMYLILDFSDSMQQSDYKPNRIDFVIAELCNKYIPEFFRSNPLSYISIIVMRNGSAHFVTKMNGQPKFQVKQLKEFATTHNPSGSCSLVAALDLILKSSDAPQYATKEILLLWGSLNSIDPPTTPLHPFMTEKVRTSDAAAIHVISLSPEVFAVKKLSECLAGSSFSVPMNGIDFASALHATVTPRPTTSSAKPVYIKMGFPMKFFDAVKLVKCVCHREFHNAVYSCPQCQSMVCEIPVACPVCKLTLCDKDMLTRVHRLLYDMPEFVDGSGECCFGCDGPNARGMCVECRCVFCAECEAFAHDTLRHCIGCLARVDN